MEHSRQAHQDEHSRPAQDHSPPAAGQPADRNFRLRDIGHDYDNFTGMTADPVDLKDLLAVRDRMIRELQQGLDAAERHFLLSFVANQPEWSLLDLPHLEHLPGIRWKLQNLERLQKANANKFAAQSDALARLLA